MCTGRLKEVLKLSGWEDESGTDDGMDRSIGVWIAEDWRGWVNCALDSCESSGQSEWSAPMVGVEALSILCGDECESVVERVESV